MRVVGEIPHPELKITIFEWNNKYLVKLEMNALEQTFKIDQLDILDKDELYTLLDQTFLNQAVSRFHQMRQSLLEAMQRA